MSNEQQQKSFLAKAKEAEDQAGKVRDSSLRDSWLAIAQRYRDLAKHQAM